MFDHNVVVPGSLANVVTGGAVSGYEFRLRIPYYRGLGLSMVSVSAEVDGAPVDPRDMSFTVHGNTYRLDQLEDVLDDRWPFTEAATVTVAKPGGVTSGEHRVRAKVHLRVSYVPAGFGAVDEKVLVVPGRDGR